MELRWNVEKHLVELFRSFTDALDLIWSFDSTRLANGHGTIHGLGLREILGYLLISRNRHNVHFEPERGSRIRNRSTQLGIAPQGNDVPDCRFGFGALVTLTHGQNRLALTGEPKNGNLDSTGEIKQIYILE